MVSSLSGKVAFITGGASGIGAALATKLVEGGAEVWLADRQLVAAQELAQRLSGDGTKAHAIELDVRSYPAFEAAVAEAVQRSGRIDYLFNNAGIGVGGEVDSYTLDDWNDVLAVNLHGVVHGIQAVYPIMIRQHSGHIVNTASMAGLLAGPGTASYTASKHARRRAVEGDAAGGRAPQREGVGAVPRRDPYPHPHRRRVWADDEHGCQRRRPAQILGADAAHGSRQIRHPRSSSRVTRGRDRHRAVLVEGAVVPRRFLADYFDAGRA